MLGDLERDVAAVAPRPVLRDTAEAKAGDLGGAETIAQVDSRCQIGGVR